MEALDERKDCILQSDDEAQDAVERIQYWEDQKAKWSAYYDEQKDAFIKKAEAKIAYQQMLLEQYFNRVPHHRTKTTESYPLMGCKLIVTKAHDELEKGSEDTIKLWLAENEITGFVEVETKEKLKWGELRKRLTIKDGRVADKLTGAFVDGVNVKHVENNFAVRMTKGEEPNED